MRVCKRVHPRAGEWPGWKAYHGGSDIGEMTSGSGYEGSQSLVGGIAFF